MGPVVNASQNQSICLKIEYFNPRSTTTPHLFKKHEIIAFSLLYWLSVEVLALVLGTPFPENCGLIRKLSRKKQD